MKVCWLFLFVLGACDNIGGGEARKVELDTKTKKVIPGELPIYLKADGELANSKLRAEGGTWHFIGFLPSMSRDGTKLSGISIDGIYTVNWYNEHDVAIKLSTITLDFVDLNRISIAEAKASGGIIPPLSRKTISGNFRFRASDLNSIRMIDSLVVSTWGQTLD